MPLADRMRYLLSAFFYRSDHLKIEKLENYSSYEETYIASVTVSELLAGVRLAKNISIQLRRTAFVENILATIPILYLDEKVARTYAEIYAYYQRINPASTFMIYK